MGEHAKENLNIATLSLVFGCISILIFPFGLVAIILGIFALNKISKNKDTLKGKEFAITGIALGTVILVVYGTIYMRNYLMQRRIHDAEMQFNSGIK